MNCIALIILAVRNYDVEGWTDILVIVVLAAFWVVGAILKTRARAKANKPSDLDRQQQLSRKGRVVQSANSSRPQQLQPRPQIQPPRRKVMRPSSAAVGFAAEKQPRQSKLLSAVAPSEMGIKQSLELVGKPLKKLEDKVLGLSAETVQLSRSAELLEPEPVLVLDLADAEELRRAVLHYEILGKPISLRDRSAQIIGL